MTTTRRLLLATGFSAALTGLALAQTTTATPPAASATAATGTRFITMSSTTSTQDSGLFGHILPLFKAKTGIEVRVVSQGTGQALDTGRRGDADVVFVHARAQEEKFVADGFGLERKPVMYNDFVLIGPKGDPAGISGSKDIAAALVKIAEKGAPFVSRGDKSGTHSAELGALEGRGRRSSRPRRAPGTARSARAWGPRSTPPAAWALMCWPTVAPGSPSRIAAISRLRWRATVACSTSTASSLVNPAKHPHVKIRPTGRPSSNWLVSPEGQKAIADYKIEGRAAVLPQCDAGGRVIPCATAFSQVSS